MTDAATADRPLATGRLESIDADTLVLGIPGTDYRIHLVGKPPEGAGPGARITGRITARAKRVDKVPSGGRFIEPVFGRPRRVQGRIIAGDTAANTITVDCGVPVVCGFTDARQNAAQFAIGQLVSFDIERGATFEPMTTIPG
jgi:hypothetical protein